MDNKQLNYATAVLDKVLSKYPTTSVGIVLAPHLISEKVNGGLRGEIRSLGSTRYRLRGPLMHMCWYTFSSDSPKYIKTSHFPVSELIDRPLDPQEYIATFVL